MGNPTKRPATRKNTAATVTATATHQHTNNAAVVVGIGASAGGLEALEQFFKNVPENSGLAFVVIQHLDPTHKAMLPHLLQRVTTMKVIQADNRMEVLPDHVYVIPPNKDLSILHTELYLLDPVAPRGLRLPIDFFLRTLAKDKRECAIGVILSGMGSDGTFGLRAIKEKVGLTVVQDPESAKFDGMPLSAIDAGLADIVAEPKDIPAKIISYIKTLHRPSHAIPIRTDHADSALEQILVLLRERTGNDFSLYKTNTLYRRIERRMGLHRIKDMATYVTFLRENSKELDMLFKELLIGVTNFFRDPSVWEYLKNAAIPALLEHYPQGKAFRAWVTGCSTGEEAFSLAIVFKEVLEQVRPKARFTLQIFATDLDEDAITKARQGHYAKNIAGDISAERLSRYFTEDNQGYRIVSEIRKEVIFAPQNIFMDPPFIKLDILTCRNVLIYLRSELQHKLIPLFHYALNPKGMLMLGNAESIGIFTNLFKAFDKKLSLYERVDTSSYRVVEFPTKHFPVQPSLQEDPKVVHTQANFQHQADQLLLQHLAPAAVLVNADGDIVYFNGRTGKYLEPAAGKVNLNIYAMAREGLRYELASALKTVNRTHAPVSLQGLRIVEENGMASAINVTVQPIDKPAALQGMVMISFSDAPSLPASSKSDLPCSHNTKEMRELEQARAEIAALRDEMQSSKEELTSANEELQSMNEELQSTNEELTTSKEEMQSLNEELQTVNAELQARVEDLAMANSDLNNLLNSTEIATVFLDNSLHVRRFTNQATRIFKLIPSDAGRALSDIVSNLEYRELQADALEVLRTLIFSDKQIATNDGRWYKVRIMPYRTLENVIDGVVITFSDITTFKALEAELRSTSPTRN
jgi:two-component system CheB/CheR fusion protein